jgi:hypothetical protein
MYKQFGDDEIIGHHYAKMRKRLEHMKNKYMDGRKKGINYYTVK